MLTPKMHNIADAIGNYIYEYFNEEFLDILFSNGFFVEDIIFHVLVICCKNAYLINTEKHPLSYYIEKEGLEAELARKVHERVIKYVKEKNTILNDYTEKNTGDSILSPEIKLVRENSRFSGYSFSELQYWESKNIHDMELVKAIIDRRIVASNKNYTNSRFRTISEAYDEDVEEMKSRFGKDPESTVFSSIQFFTLQTRYAFDFYYEVAARCEDFGIKKIPNLYNRIMTVSGTYKCDSLLPQLYPGLAGDFDQKIEYPMIIQRRRFIDLIINEVEDSRIDLMLALFIEANVLANAVRSHMFIDEKILPLLIVQDTGIEDWASVFEIFNVFQTFIPNKEWTDARIKIVRNIYDTISVDYKSLSHPKNRP